MHGVFTDCSHNSDNLKHVRAKVGYPTICLTVLVGQPTPSGKLLSHGLLRIQNVHRGSVAVSPNFSDHPPLRKNGNVYIAAIYVCREIGLLLSFVYFFGLVTRQCC
jgi:hypothetical protein